MSKTSRIPKKIAAAAIGAGVIAAGLLAAPTPAFASGNYIQVFKDANYSGPYAWINQDDSNLTDNRFTDGTNVNDQISSIKNASDRQVCFYRHTNYVGDLFCLRPGYEWAWVGSTNNDAISSNFSNFGF